MSADVQVTEQASSPKKKRPYAWTFFSAALVLLGLTLAGQGVGVLIDPYLRAILEGHRTGGFAGMFSAPSIYVEQHGFTRRDWIFLGFLVSSTVYVVLMRKPIARFFRSMVTGVSLVTMITLAICIGVLVPQLKDVEDPDYRVNEQNYQENFASFAWAEGYFFYHLSHLFGRGLPQGELPPQVEEGLDRFARVYGEEEASNRRKTMTAMFGGQEKTAAIETWIDDNYDGLRNWFDVVTALHLNRTYKSKWFATLMVLLLVAVAFNTFKGNPRQLVTPAKLGFFATHLGVMTLLIGGGFSALFTDRGILQLDLRHGPQDTYWRHYDPSKKARMPFAVGLDYFARRDWPQLQVEFPEENFSSRAPQYTLWEGRRIELDLREQEDGSVRPALAIEVDTIHDRAIVNPPRITEGYDPSQPDVVYPLADLRLPDPRHAPGDGHNHDEVITMPEYLRPTSTFLEERMHYDPGMRFRLKASWGGDPTDVFPVREGVVGELEVEVVGLNDGEPRKLPIAIGDQLELPGGYTANVVKATANFQLDGPGKNEIVDSRPLAQQPPRRPAVTVHIRPPGGGEVEKRLVLHHLDARDNEMQSGFLYPDVVVALRWDLWRSPGPPRYVLHWGLGEDPSLLSETGSRWPVEVGEPLPAPGLEMVEVRGLVNLIEAEPDVSFLADRIAEDGWDADFYSNAARGVELTVIRDPGTPEEQREQVSLASFALATEGPDLNSTWRPDDGRFELFFFENDRAMPFEWRSVLSIYEPDGDGEPYKVPLGTERQREIRVNDYFYYKGFRFFQTNADAQMPTYSGIGVVYDPGIPIVLIGMYTIIFGIAWAFLVRPIFLARKRRSAA